MNTRTWPSQRNQRPTLQSESIFILGIFTRICKWWSNMFWVSGRTFSLNLSLSLLILEEIMGSFWDISYILSLHEVVVMLMRKKMSHHVCTIVLFKYESMEPVVVLSSRISSLPPMFMSFISWLTICLFMLIIILFSNYLFYIKWLSTRGYSLMKWWIDGSTSCTTSPDMSWPYLQGHGAPGKYVCHLYFFHFHTYFSW
jgi:hypothetical protein